MESGFISFLMKKADNDAALPSIAVQEQPASEKHTLPGMVPPISYSKVNSGTPPTPDAGSSAQKSQVPLGMMSLPKQAFATSEEIKMSMTGRPLIQDLIKSAAQTGVRRAKVASEATRQMAEESEEEKKKKEKESNAYCAPGMKTASGEEEVTTKYAHSLADAVDYCLPEIMKISANTTRANITETTQKAAPGVLESNRKDPPMEASGQGQARNGIPMSTPEQKTTSAGPTTQVQTNENDPPGSGTSQQTSLTGSKMASLLQSNLAFLQKKASENPMVDAFIAHIKKAEDAINPAQISAGAAVPPETSAAGEASPPPAGGAPQGPTNLVASNEAAINYTKGQAYENRKQDLKSMLNEPALSAATDKTLQQAFAHTGEAGVKISSAQNIVKTAAARALIAKLASGLEPKVK